MHLKGGLEAGLLWPLRGLFLGLRPHVALVYLWCHQESGRTCDHQVEEPRVTMRGAGLALLLPVCTTSWSALCPSSRLAWGFPIVGKGGAHSSPYKGPFLVKYSSPGVWSLNIPKAAGL